MNVALVILMVGYVACGCVFCAVSFMAAYSRDRFGAAWATMGTVLLSAFTGFLIELARDDDEPSRVFLIPIGCACCVLLVGHSLIQYCHNHLKLAIDVRIRPFRWKRSRRRECLPLEEPNWRSSSNDGSALTSLWVDDRDINPNSAAWHGSDIRHNSRNSDVPG